MTKKQLEHRVRQAQKSYETSCKRLEASYDSLNAAWRLEGTVTEKQMQAWVRQKLKAHDTANQRWKAAFDALCSAKKKLRAAAASESILREIRRVTQWQGQ